MSMLRPFCEACMFFTSNHSKAANIKSSVTAVPTSLSKNPKQAFSGVTGGYLQNHSRFFPCCQIGGACRVFTGTLGRAVALDRPTDSQRGCLWRIPTEEVSLSELSGTVMCIRLCRRPPQRQFFRGWGLCFYFISSVGDIMRDSLAVNCFFRSLVIKAFHFSRQ